MKDHFRGMWQQTLEGDYAIICPASKLKLVKEQLEDFEEFIKDKNDPTPELDSDKVKIYYLPGTKVVQDFFGLYQITEKETKAVISLKIPPETIDKVAQEKKLKCSVTMLQNKQKVNVPFDTKRDYLFSCFAAAEKCEAIEEFLEQNMNFEYLTENQVVNEHFHLHKATVVEDIQGSYDRNWFRLTCRMMNFDNSFIRYMQPLNMTVQYFGEKIAFEYAFLIHYNAWLAIGSVGGIALFVA